ncbi:MAG: HAD family phosphatase [Candidatus Omnitrophica bacterium]|nr:HAD family phosphatase [Candidatus Omnitrophota bacterium]
MYDLVLFDLGGVVVEVNSDQLLHHVAQLTGKSFEEVQAVIYHKDLLLPFELGRITPQAYYEGLKAQLAFSWTYEQFVRAWNSLFIENTDVTQLMERLQKRHTLIALSNTNRLHLMHIQQHFPSLTVFHDWIASSDVGMRKPDPEIYHLAVRRGGARVERTIYIDDRPELVQAGRNVGLQAIRFENSQQLEEELRALGVNV